MSFFVVSDMPSRKDIFYCEEKISFRDGMPLTTKKDKHLHGFGMKSIQSTVRKYGGSVRAGLRDNWFEVSILIPLKERKS